MGTPTLASPTKVGVGSVSTMFQMTGEYESGGLRYVINRKTRETTSELLYVLVETLRTNLEEFTHAHLDAPGC